MLHEFVAAMRKMGIAPARNWFWYNEGIRDSRRDKRQRSVPEMDGWVLHFSEGQYSGDRSRIWVTPSAEVYSGNLPKRPTMFSYGGCVQFAWSTNGRGKGT